MTSDIKYTSSVSRNNNNNFDTAQGQKDSRRTSLEKITYSSYSTHVASRSDQRSHPEKDQRSSEREGQKRSYSTYTSYEYHRRDDRSEKTRSDDRYERTRSSDRSEGTRSDQSEKIASAKEEQRESEKTRKRNFDQINSDNTSYLPASKKTKEEPEKKAPPKTAPAKKSSAISGFHMLAPSDSDEDSVEETGLFGVSEFTSFEQIQKKENIDPLSEFFQMRKQPLLLETTRTELHIQGKNRRIDHLASGTFHDVFNIENMETVLLKTVGKCTKWSNAGRPITAKHDGKNYTLVKRHRVLYQGYESYRDLKTSGFRVPKIINETTLFADGYYLIEKIHGSPVLEHWQDSSTPFGRLQPKAQEQLEQVRSCLSRMKKANRLLVPDFKPHNVGFNNQNQLVILDFCEDNEIPAFQKPLDDLLEEYAESWACGNKRIKDYLLG